MPKQLVQAVATKLIVCAPELQSYDASELGDSLAFGSSMARIAI